MAQIIKLRRSSTAGKVPTTSDLNLGELAINTNDGRIFFEKNDGSAAIKHVVTSDSQTTGSIEITGNISGSHASTGSFGSLLVDNYNQNRGPNTNTIIGISNGVTTAVGSTLIGFEAGNAVSDKNYNTFVGYQAGKLTSAHDSNTAIGYLALGGASAAYSNTAVGREALKAMTGNQGVAIGEGAAKSNTAHQITAIGAYALTANTTGLGNVALGFQSLYTNVDGDNNTAIGYKSLRTFEAGSDGLGGNTTLGYYSGYSLNTGIDNTLVGSGSGGVATTASGSVFVGAGAGGITTTGNNNILIGKGVNASSATTSNETVIGTSEQQSVKFGGNVTIGDGSGNISGSATSTGSFGRVEANGSLNVSGSVGITGSLLLTGTSGTPNAKLIIDSSNDKLNIGDTIVINDSNNRIGIGDSAPSSPDTEFHIKSDTPVITLQRTNNNQKSSIDFQGQNGSVGSAIVFEADSNALLFQTFDSSNPHEKLKIEDGASGQIKASGSFQITGSLSVSNEIETGNDFIVNSSGRVGINTLAPDYKLDVAGNMGVNEYIYHNGDSNTYVRFQNDQVDLSAGGNVFQITSTSLSGSGTSTGSFGRVEVNANTISIGGTELSKTVADNITGLDQELGTDSKPAFSALTASNAIHVGSTSFTISQNGDGDAEIDTDLVVLGDITAQNYIVSSSITHLTQSFSSGSTVFGDTSDDTHQFTGSLSAQGALTLGSTLTAQGNVEIRKSFPDLNLRAGDEQRINFNDDGNSIESGIKNNSGTMKFYGSNSSNTIRLTLNDTVAYFAGNVSGSGASTGSFGHLLVDGQKPLTPRQKAITGTSTTAIDFKDSNNFKVSLTDDVTISSSNEAHSIGSSGMIVLVQDASGGHTVTLPSSFKTPRGDDIAFTSGSNDISIISYYVIDGSNVAINYMGNFS